ncbi:MAG: DUF72 domain-containing protein [Bryobacteraceae bacterium]|nr:DUF72 domain-containing protein [Bryobacteraceae bacterium]
METLPLFDDPEPGPRSPLALRLHELAARGIYFGTSSWKYPGWMGSIYTPQRYFTRGRFSQKKFEAECLAEYAETFPAVCGDFSFYQFPEPSYWFRLFAGAPKELQFAFKVPEEITVKTWPTHVRYGARGGSENDSFLNAGLFERMFAQPLEPYAGRVGVLIFEFGTLPKRHYDGVGPFVDDLSRFLAALPRGWRYAVEVRNPEYLDPVYFDCLRSFNVAHVFNAWTRMPELPGQIAIEEAFTADFLVARALLRQGRPYADAVAKFQPYERVQEPNPGARAALKELMDRASRSRQLAFLFVNNRLEGNAPGTIEAVID